MTLYKDVIVLINNSVSVYICRTELNLIKRYGIEIFTHNEQIIVLVYLRVAVHVALKNNGIGSAADGYDTAVGNYIALGKLRAVNHARALCRNLRNDISGGGFIGCAVYIIAVESDIHAVAELDKRGESPFVEKPFVTFLEQGAAQVSTNFDIDSSFPSMVVGIVLFFIIGCEFFIGYKLKFRKAAKNGGES